MVSFALTRGTVLSGFEEAGRATVQSKDTGDMSEMGKGVLRHFGNNNRKKVRVFRSSKELSHSQTLIFRTRIVSSDLPETQGSDSCGSTDADA